MRTSKPPALIEFIQNEFKFHTGQMRTVTAGGPEIHLQMFKFHTGQMRTIAPLRATPNLISV